MFSGFGTTIEKFDFLGQTVNLRINNSSSIRTSCGGISSLFILSSLVLIFQLFFLPLITQEKPDVNFIHQKEISPKRVNLTNTNFLLGYSIENSNFPLSNLSEFLEIRFVNYISMKVNDTSSRIFNKTFKGIIFFEFNIFFL